jgi:hypothetical protein
MDEESEPRKLPIRSLVLAVVALAIIGAGVWQYQSQRQQDAVQAARDRLAECKLWRIKDPKLLAQCQQSAKGKAAIVNKLTGQQRQQFFQGYTQNSTLLAQKLPPIDKSLYRAATIEALHGAGAGKATVTAQDLAPLVEKFGPGVKLSATILSNQLPGRVKKGQLPKFTLALVANSEGEPAQHWMIPAKGTKLHPFEQQFLLFFCGRKSLVSCQVEVFGKLATWKVARSATAPMDAGLMLHRVVFQPVTKDQVAQVPPPRAAFFK